PRQVRIPIYDTCARCAGRAQAHGSSPVLEIVWLSDHPDIGPKPPARQRTVNGTWAVASRGVHTTPWPQFNPAPASMTSLDATEGKIQISEGARCERWLFCIKPAARVALLRSRRLSRGHGIPVMPRMARANGV